jgi:hypothetical protein
MRAPIFALLSVVASAAPAWGDDIASADLKVTPTSVPIGLFYSGATLEVSAQVPPGVEAALLVTGHSGRLELKRKGTRAGVLWMSVGEVAFDKVPVLYHLLTSAPLKGLASPEALRDLRMGYEALVPAPAGESGARDELIKLKTSEGLFALREGGFARGREVARPIAAASGPIGDVGRVALTAKVELPSLAPAGEYTVELVGFRDHKPFALGRTTVSLEHAGAVKALRQLAIDHGLLYGIAAVAIAIAVGLLTGLIFEPKSGESH